MVATTSIQVFSIWYLRSCFSSSLTAVSVVDIVDGKMNGGITLWAKANDITTFSKKEKNKIDLFLLLFLCVAHGLHGP